MSADMKWLEKMMSDPHLSEIGFVDSGRTANKKFSAELRAALRNLGGAASATPDVSVPVGTTPPIGHIAAEYIEQLEQELKDVRFAVKIQTINLIRKGIDHGLLEELGGGRMSEVRRDPIKTEDTDGNPVITFTEDHNIRDIIRYLLSTGVDAAELIYHINDPTLRAEQERK